MRRLEMAHPCQLPWDGMEGDAGVRRCAVCARDVHDLSAMTELDAAALVLFSGGCGVCVRFEADASGEVRHARPIAGTRVAAGLATLALGALAAACVPAPAPPVPLPEPTLAQRVAAALDEVPDPPAAPSVAPAATEEPPRPAEETRHGVIVETMGIAVARRVHFGWNGHTISRDGGKLLDDVAEVMTRHPELRLVRVEGHASPDEPRPVELGEERAQAVLAALRGRKVDPARLVAQSYGATRPIASNDTQEGRAHNRRVEFVVLDKSCPAPNAAPAP